MSERITDELRRWSAHLAPKYDRAALIQIADVIDEAHERALASVRAEYEGQAHDADELVPIVAECASDKALADAGLVRLPKDADGETLRIGDDVLIADGLHLRVGALLGRDRDWVLLYGEGLDSDWFNGEWYGTDSLHHYKPTPAERIRTAVRLLTDEDEPQDAKALRDLLAIADELEGSE